MRILLFGATGSISTQLLDVIGEHQLVGITFNQNYEKARPIIEKYKLEYFLCHSNPSISSVKDVDELIKKTNPDLIVNAVTGVAGLPISIKAIESKRDLALANKESLVIAGKFINELAIKNNVKIYPIDSEHSSLFSLLERKNEHIKQLIITCSGGSTYFKKREELENISFQEVIQHPNWNMGYKISVDSATLMNKCFEIVEAYWLFGKPAIKAVLHPQSIVHSMVMYSDNSIWMSASFPSMKLPIKLAINKYSDVDECIPELKFENLSLTFDEISIEEHLPIKWAYDIINDENNVLGLVINSANDIAVELFKEGKIKFLEIIPFIEYFYKTYAHKKIKNIDDIFYLLDKIIKSNYEQVIQDIRNNKNN